MSWTEERVERLTKLWLEGRSASFIAEDLGLGVTRNAVIGKVHRLGLSGRANSAEAADGKSLRGKNVRAAGRPATTAEESAAAEPQPIALPVTPVGTREDVALAVSDRVTILELRESMCRWPLGDPTSAEFRFCGCRAQEGVPYCSTHARVAFQPIAERRRVERIARFA